MTGVTDSGTVQSRARGWKLTTRTALVALLAIPAGVGLAIFGFFGWCIGPLVLIGGLVGQRLRRGWSSWAIWIGIGLTLGALAYIAIGLLTPDGPSSGGGSGSPPS